MTALPSKGKVCLVSRVTPVQTASRNCAGDEGGPFGFGDQVADSKAPQAAAVKSRGGERCGKVGTMIPAGMVERGERTTERFEAALGKPLEAPALAKVTKIAQGLSWTGVAHLGVAVLVGDVPNAPREALTISSALRANRLAQIYQK